jgi:hypothetical protein
MKNTPAYASKGKMRKGFDERWGIEKGEVKLVYRHCTPWNDTRKARCLAEGTTGVQPMTGTTSDPDTTRPPLPPPIWQWLCMVVIIAWVVAVWFLWR